MSEFTAKIRDRWLAEAKHTDSTLDYAICEILNLCKRLDSEKAINKDLLAACKESPAPNWFSEFATFAEVCSLKPNMAVYKQRFVQLATFLRSCVDRAEKIVAAIAKAQPVEENKE